MILSKCKCMILSPAPNHYPIVTHRAVKIFSVELKLVSDVCRTITSHLPHQKYKNTKIENTEIGFRCMRATHTSRITS